MESQQSDSFRRPNCYLAWDQRGNTQIIKNPYDISIYNHAFIRIHYESPLSSTKNQLFVDREFQITRGMLSTLSDQEVVIKRISELYPSRHGEPLFLQSMQTKRLKDYNKLLPHFVYQMYLFQEITFKRLFITQHISKQGRYDVLINRDGYFQVQTVDDYVPVAKKSQRPIWQLEPKRLWQLILAKLWAKKQGGYDKIKDTKPFEFISYFTPCTWKYFNLAKEGRQFLANYSQKVPNSCKIFLKSKLESEVVRAGLVSDRVVYELIEFDEFVAKDKKEFNLLIKSVVPHQWTGSLSIFDKEFLNIFKRLKNDFQLESTFLINQPDFFNIFSRAFVTTSKVNFPEFITSERLFVPKNNKHPCFFRFTILTKGYLILTIRQDESNKKKAANFFGMQRVRLSSLRSIGECPAGQRYLEVKFILAKINLRSQQGLKDSFVCQIEKKRKKESKLSPGKEQKQFKHLEYILQDFDFTKGKNKGEAHPIQIGPGTYIMRIITEKTYNQSTFNIQCISHENVLITPIDPDIQTQLTILKDSLLSVSHTMPTQQLSEKVAISFGFEFDTIGYGFIAIQTEKDLEGALVVRVDPILLMKEGYKLKIDYQSKKQVFHKQLGAFENEVFIFERFEEVVKEYIWPPSSFKFFMSQK